MRRSKGVDGRKDGTAYRGIERVREGEGEREKARETLESQDNDSSLSLECHLQHSAVPFESSQPLCLFNFEVIMDMHK